MTKKTDRAPDAGIFDAGVIAFESTIGSRHSITTPGPGHPDHPQYAVAEGTWASGIADCPRYTEAMQVHSGIAVCPSGKPPGCGDDWTWQNVATVGLFMVCLAWILSSLFRSMR